MPNWILRAASIEDAPELTDLINAAFAQYNDEIDDLPPVSEDIAGEIVRNQVWVADIGGKIIGCLVMMAGDSWVKLANLAVHPSYSGQGLGKALIEHFESEARRQGFKEFRLMTHAAMAKNIELYSKLGWAVFERAGNSVAMRKSI